MTANTNTNLTSGISHVGLSVSDIEKSFKFFESIGYNLIGGDESYPSYFLSDGESMVTLWQTDAGATPFDRRSNVGLHHLAIQIPSLEALKKVYDTVMAIDGVKSDFAPQELNGTTLTHAMVYEPSGNRIEFTHHAIEYMA
jgi:catechol 2,3-dioxygenase-like lactoylglutathione lyase family enzyme